MAQILIVENDHRLSELLATHFSRRKHHCHTAPSLSRTYKLLDKRFYDLLLLDRAVDDGDTLEIASYLRDLQAPTKVLFLSESGTTQDRITGLEQGADEYLPKPFSLAELSLRVERLLNLHKEFSNSLIFDGISLKTDTGVASFANQTIKLRKKETRILASLLRHQYQIISRDQMITEVWGSMATVPSYTTVDAYIRKIRMKLKQAPLSILTHRGVGYQLIPNDGVSR